MRRHMAVVIVVLLIVGQPLVGAASPWQLSRLLLPLVGLATCVGGLRMVLPCLWQASPGELGR